MFLLARCVQLLFTDAADMGGVAELRGCRLACRIIVPFVQAQVLRLLFGRLGPLDHDGI